LEIQIKIYGKIALHSEGSCVFYRWQSDPPPPTATPINNSRHQAQPPTTWGTRRSPSTKI